MRGPRAWGLLLMVLLAGQGRADDRGVLEMEALGTIEVAPDGSVHHYTLDTKLQREVAKLVEATVRGWTFDPITVDGRPVIATTRMRLSLEAVPRDDAYVLRVADVSFGEPERGRNMPPEYPLDALRRGVQARVSLLLQVDATGQVGQVHVEQVSLGEEAGRRGDHWRKLFANASSAAASSWTFEPALTLAGRPEPMRLRVPVTFTLSTHGQWREAPDFIPGPVHPSPWPGVSPLTDADATGDDVQPLDTPIRLRDDVIGTEL